jgi:putative ABC transport system substrate-binding protein
MEENPMKIKDSRTTAAGRTLTAIILIALTIGSVTGCSNSRPKVYRIGILSGLNFVTSIADSFMDEMTELGYEAGKNVVYDLQRTDFDMDAYKKILAKFVEDKVDLIVVFPTEATIEAKLATEGTRIPVVFTFALVEGMGIIESVAAPGGNNTGVRYPGPDIALKRFEIMQEIVPAAKRYLLPYQKGYPIVAEQLKVLAPAAKAAGIELVEAPAADAAELRSVIEGLERSGAGADAVLILVEPLAVVPEPFEVMAEYAYRKKIPIGGALMAAGNYSSVFGVNTDLDVCGREAAVYADKVLKGTPAGTIPVSSGENLFEINYAAAQTLGLTIPEGLLRQAQNVIR